MPAEPNPRGVPPAPTERPAVPPAAPAVVSGTEGAPEVSKLTPEEQMALFEKELKETDWGHQPC